MSQQTKEMYQQKKNALERLDALEGDTLPRLIGSLNDALGQFAQRLDTTARVMDALVTLVGRDQVEAELQRVLDVEMAERVAKAQEELAAMKEKGILFESEFVEESSMIVGYETAPDGSVSPPGWISVKFVQLLPEMKPLFVGLKVGAVVETKEGRKFTITDLMTFDKTKAKA